MHWRAVRIASDMGQAAHRLEDPGEAGLADIGTGLAKGGCPQHHEFRVGLPQSLDIEAPAVQRAGLEILDQYVELGQHFQEKLGAFLLAQVQRAKLLAAIRRLPPEGFSVLERGESAHAVTRSRKLQLDYIGTEIGQQSTGERGRNNRGDIKNTQAGEGPGLAVVCHSNSQRLFLFL